MTASPPTPTRRPDVELVLAQLDTLPALAPVAARILTLTSDPKTQAREITELVGSDPSLTARVLSFLARAQNGLRPEAVTLENAVRMLGFETLRQIALAAKVQEVFGRDDRAEGEDGLNRLEFWKHCLAVACAARRIALALPGLIPPEEAFILGLLHDLGKMALNTALPKSYRRVLRQADQTCADISEIECQVLGVDHTVAGHRLAERWNLPQRLIETIWLHHQEPGALPESVASGRHVQIVQLADTIAREQRIGYSGNHRFPHSSRSLAEALGFPEGDRQMLLESLAEEIESRAAWIGAEQMTSREVYLRALLQSTEELSAANSALSARNARLQRKSAYFSALGWLSQAVSPRMSVREVCSAGAEALRRALGLEAALIFTDGPEHRWTEVGFSAGTMHGEILEQAAPRAEADSDAANALRMAEAGLWVAPLGRSFAGIADRFHGRLGEGPVWLLPVVCQRKWAGGALFAAEPGVLAELRGETAELEALSAAIGLTIAQAQAQAAARQLSDELAQINRRWAAMQAELLRARTLESIVAMAAGAAHELNNPLAVISGRAQMLRNTATDEDARVTLDTIAKQAHDCSEIVKQLMEFAQPSEARPEHVGLRDVLDGVYRELIDAGTIESDGLALDIGPDVPPVWMDRSVLTRLLRELIDNAIEATADAARRRITVKAECDLAEEIAVVTVTDNGRGMTADVTGRAMDPFFSHRPAGRGRGLGLARVARWVADARGGIRIDSRPGDGTRIELRLPIHGESQGGALGASGQDA